MGKTGTLPSAILFAVAITACASTPTAEPVAPRQDAGVRPVDARLSVPEAERRSEDARLRALGLRVPDEGLVLERPFEPPYSRRSFVVPQQWFRSVPDGARVLPEQLRADLKVLQPLMARAYGGWDSAAARGFDWQKWFADWETRLAAAPPGQPIALAEAFAPVKQLMDVQLDNHTTLPLSKETRFGSSSRAARVLGAPTGPCTELRNAEGRIHPLDPKDPSQQVRKAQSWEASTKKTSETRYVAFPSSRGDVTSIHCGDVWLPVTRAWEGADANARQRPILQLSGAAEDGPDLKLLEPTIAYLRLPEFTKRNTQLIEERMPTWPKPSGKEKVLIVDLRNNGGGDVALAALEGWVDDKRVAKAFEKAVNTHRVQGASCLYHALRWGYGSVSSRGLEGPLGPQLKAGLQSGLDDLFQPSPPDCPRAFTETRSDWGYKDHRFISEPGPVEGNRRIVVLVNNGCGSDCEMMTDILAALPETVIVGTNTFGVAQFIQPGYSVMPHTRLPFRIALGMADQYGDGRSFDGYGFDVDILLPTEADQSAASILALARSLQR